MTAAQFYLFNHLVTFDYFNYFKSEIRIQSNHLLHHELKGEVSSGLPHFLSQHIPISFLLGTTSLFFSHSFYAVGVSLPLKLFFSHLCRCLVTTSVL